MGLRSPGSTVQTRVFCPWNFPGNNTGVGSHSLLQGIFPAQGLRTPVYLHCRQILSCLNHQGSPRRLAFKSLAHRLPLPRAWCRGSPLKSPQTFCERDLFADLKTSAYRDESHSLSGRGWRCWQAPLTCASSPSLKSVGYNCFLLSSHPRPPKATPLHQYSTLGCPWSLQLQPRGAEAGMPSSCPPSAWLQLASIPQKWVYTFVLVFTLSSSRHLQVAWLSWPAGLVLASHSTVYILLWSTDTL